MEEHINQLQHELTNLTCQSPLPISQASDEYDVNYQVNLSILLVYCWYIISILLVYY